MAKVGTIAEAGSNLAVAVDTKIADSYTTPDTVNLTYNRVFVYGTGSSATCYLKFGIYTDNAGTPNALVANSAVTLPVFTTVGGWRSATFATRPTLVKNTKYHLAVVCGDSAGESVTLLQNNGAANQESDAVADEYDDGLADPWGGAGTRSAKKCTIYIRGRCWAATMGKRWRK
jgi:hypothetical protein